jgi:nucleoside-diphosphate-sugar epimerase
VSEWVAITGATGFIGRQICRLLHENGWKVRVLVRSRERAQTLEGIIDEQVYGDLHDGPALEKLVSDVFAVVHCAGAVRGASQQAFDRVNAEGVRNLVDAMRASPRAPRLLSLSSLAAREPALSFYAASKRKGEQVLEQQARDLNWIALRPPAVYGPGDRELLPLFQLMARGLALVPGLRHARFSMIFVEDIARLVLAWLLHEPVTRGVYSLHDGQKGGYSWNDLTAAVEGLCQRRVRAFFIPQILLNVPAWINRRLALMLGYQPMLTPQKLRELRHPDWVCDNEAIQQVLDWQPLVQLEEGLRRTPGWCSKLDTV